VIAIMLRVERLKIAGLPPLSFEVPAGECLAVEGVSGAGKTRLLRAIADLDDAAGLVSFGGAERADMAPAQWRRQVRFVPAESAWWAETPRLHFAVNSTPERWLPNLGLEVRHLDTGIAQLSTGERQRLALLRALLDEPPVLLLDEPTAALDPANAALVEELLRFQLLSGRIILLVSHDDQQIERLSHARLLLGRGATAQAEPSTVQVRS
jgi:ABC-type transport system involved in cytochrome bd biosynthesis fused ATPase/permease subunit